MRPAAYANLLTSFLFFVEKSKGLFLFQVFWLFQYTTSQRPWHQGK
jgi:hypothetical protein